MSSIPVEVNVVAVPLKAGADKVLFVSVSVVALPTTVSSLTAVLSSAIVPVTVLVVKLIDLFVSVSVVALPTTVSSLTAVLNSASVPVTVLSVRSILLFVSVSVVAAVM